MAKENFEKFYGKVEEGYNKIEGGIYEGPECGNAINVNDSTPLEDVLINDKVCVDKKYQIINLSIMVSFADIDKKLRETLGNSIGIKWTSPADNEYGLRANSDDNSELDTFAKIYGANKTMNNGKVVLSGALGKIPVVSLPKAIVEMNRSRNYFESLTSKNTLNIREFMKSRNASWLLPKYGESSMIEGDNVYINVNIVSLVLATVGLKGKIFNSGKYTLNISYLKGTQNYEVTIRNQKLVISK